MLLLNVSKTVCVVYCNTSTVGQHKQHTVVVELSPFHFTGRRKRQVTPVSSPVTRSGRVRRSTAGLLGEPAHAKSSYANEVRQDQSGKLHADMYTGIIVTHT